MKLTAKIPPPPKIVQKQLSRQRKLKNQDAGANNNNPGAGGDKKDEQGKGEGGVKDDKTKDKPGKMSLNIKVIHHLTHPTNLTPHHRNLLSHYLVGNLLVEIAFQRNL